MRRFVRFFNEMTRQDFQEAGGKAANLGELARNRFNVPSGFCVTSGSLYHHIHENGLQNRIDAVTSCFDYNDFACMEEKTAEIRNAISSAPIPDDLYQEIGQSIRELRQAEQAFVAVRSSVAVKDSQVSSFPGMMDTYHYLREEEEIIEHIKMCWASLWTVRATLNRLHKNIDHRLALIAPVVQKMVHSEIAGVLFTANPITSVRDEMVIEANWGLGESVVSGKSMNDFYVISKSPLGLKDRRISKKTLMVCFDEEKGFGRREMDVGPDKMDAPTLSDRQVIDLGEIGLKIETLFGYPQDIEWAYEKGELFILQSRSIRTLKG
ncbi:MAG: PEP/pyruvate-binding domain-containing protein [Thermodesulfobacteriota bacterium]